MNPLVKICGLRRLEDAELSLDLGAAYLGCVMAEDSPRRATVQEVKRIASAARGRAEVVLVFRGNSGSEILSICRETGVRRVQIHGIDPQACEILRFYGLVIHPVYSVNPRSRELPVQDPIPSAARPGLLDIGEGDTNESLRWRVLGEHCPPATFIAGGVRPDNVKSLLDHQPFGIDVSHGVESAPGVKDPLLLTELFLAAKAS